METKEMLEIMQASERGQTIEMRDKAGHMKDWVTIKDPLWNWADCIYRIKPENKSCTMGFKEIREYWKNHRTEIFKINGGMFEGQIDFIDTKEQLIHICDYWYTAEDFIKYVSKEDGTLFEI